MLKRLIFFSEYNFMRLQIRQKIVRRSIEIKKNYEEDNSVEHLQSACCNTVFRRIFCIHMYLLLQ